MNYFEFYNIPARLEIDTQDLKTKFYTNSKKYHPDFFTLDGIEKQMEALEKSTFNNKAYKTLLDFEKRLKYVLDLKNILEEEGKNTIPQEFLMDMMDVNEAVMELQFDFDETSFQSIVKNISEKSRLLKENINHLLSKDIDDLSQEEFDSLKDYYLKNKYLLRLSENINKLKA